MLSLDHDPVEEIIKNSYKDFHAKGLDYICLSRTPQLTRKVYFLDGDVTKIPEVVNPHDHRYSFKTTVLAGAMLDHIYYASVGGQEGERYQIFDYRTPLNGGDGFTYKGVVDLYRDSSTKAERGQIIRRDASAVHTIQMLQDQTVLYLEQYEDIVPIDRPTRTYVKKGNPKPDLSGLYGTFTADEVIKRLAILEKLIGNK